MANADYHDKRRPVGLEDERACRHCGSMFKPLRFNSVNCSQRCRSTSNTLRWRETHGRYGKSSFVAGAIIACARCSVEFTQMKSGQATCSSKCAVAHATARWRARNPDFDAKRHHAIRCETFAHYGNGRIACVCCGEAEMKFLTIDHINGGGTKERELLNRQGVTFYLWLIKQGFPAGYQTLCMNCNYARGHWGVCPHQQAIVCEVV